MEYTCAYTHIYAKDNQIWHKRDNLYPVGHLSLLSPEDALESCEVSKTPEQSVNKRLFNMSATPADRHCESSVVVVEIDVAWLHQTHNFTLQL